MSARLFWRLALGFYALALITVMTCCMGCSSDLASPFDKPDETAQPVDCAPGCTK